MAWKIVSNNGFGWSVADTSEASAASGRVLLGAADSCKVFNGNAVGVDALFDSPVYVRAYTSPSAHTYFLHERVGYVGFVQAFVLGHPVPPSVVGGDIARLQPYAAGEKHRYISVAFMECNNARTLVPGEPPFFAYNAKLFSAGGNIDSIGSPTGALLQGVSDSPGPVPTSPSMLAQVNVPLVTEKDVDEMVDGLKPLIEVTLKPGDADRPLYQLVITEIAKAANDPNNEEAAPAGLRADVEGTITLEDIPRIRMAGRYMLLNVANPEHRQPVLAARLWNGVDASLSNPTTLTVHLLDYHDMRGPEVTATMRLVNDAVQFWKDNGYTIGVEEQSDNKKPKRGMGGLERPRIALKDGAPVLCIRLSGILYGYPIVIETDYGKNLQTLSGFSVDLKWKYDAATRIMVLDRDNIAINETDSIGVQAGEYVAALDAYQSALGKDSAKAADSPTMAGENTQSTQSTQSTEPERMTDESAPPPDEESAFRLISLGWATAATDQPRPTFPEDWEDLD